MSEYQYFEFQTVDRPLTLEQMQQIRSYSTRATITKHSFANEYHWGDFKGDADEWMRLYFDAFLYHANWGTHQLKLKLTGDLVDFNQVKAYCQSDCLAVKKHYDEIILSFYLESEPEGWEEDWQLSTFLPLRNQVSRGDYRALYIGWLLGIQQEEYEEDEFEPLVPAGLGQLNEELEALVEFLHVDIDLLQAAALKSPPIEDIFFDENAANKWLHSLTREEKDEFLHNFLIEGVKGNLSPANKFLQNFCKAQTSASQQQAQTKPRKIKELLAMAEEGTAERKRREAEQASQERAEKAKRLKQERERLLDSLEGKEPALWKEIESLVEQKQAASYKKAITLLINLRDLAARNNSKSFPERLRALREKNKRKYSFVQSIDDAALV